MNLYKANPDATIGQWHRFHKTVRTQWAAAFVRAALKKFVSQRVPRAFAGGELERLALAGGVSKQAVRAVVGRMVRDGLLEVIQ